MGGFEALKKLISSLPKDIDASFFIVWHMSSHVRGILPQALSKVSSIPVAHAVNFEPIKANRIYVAPPDHHLLLEDGLMRVTRGPKENHFRPALDPLFRSAAVSHGSRVIGIVLTGALDDGTAGLWTIKEYKGIAIVQDPKDAEVPSMPQHALANVDVDYSVPLSEMGALLADLVTIEVDGADEKPKSHTKSQFEVDIAMEKDPGFGIVDIASPSTYTCPECHGVLMSLKEGSRIRFRCHTGHAFSPESLLATINDSIENNIWSAIRSIQENVMLLNHMGDHFAENNNPKLAASFFKRAKSAEERIELLRKVVLRESPTDEILPTIQG